MECIFTQGCLAIGGTGMLTFSKKRGHHPFHSCTGKLNRPFDKMEPRLATETLSMATVGFLATFLLDAMFLLTLKEKEGIVW